MSIQLNVKTGVYSGKSCLQARPLLKWAGGKTQILGEIISRMPKKYGRYIEPFLGGGALFFAIKPVGGVISDSNPELVNMYLAIADNPSEVIGKLKAYQYTKEMFYAVRSQDWTKLSRNEAAARTIFLNKTCFNGLYRVNRKGEFNVPFGKYMNPKILDEEGIKSACLVLRENKILCGDYKEILLKYAQPNDFIFLDPPYLSVSEYADFKRYTKEKFYEKDHIELALEVNRLWELGCHIILTNSNHPLVYDLYRNFTIDVMQTKRYISCDRNARTGEDVIVTISPKFRLDVALINTSLPQQITQYPSTRYMGSKSKLLAEIWAVASQFKFETVVDLFSGSGIVGYMLKSQGKAVVSNDYMAMSYTFAKALIENKDVILSDDELSDLLELQSTVDHFVETTFKNLYFSDDDNRLIDILRSNIKKLRNPYKRAIAKAAMIRACMKKRPRGIFTYVGNRYNDGRKDLSISFRDQFIDAVKIINAAVFDNGMKNKAIHGDAMTLQNHNAELVYIDPPYYSPFSDNEYVRRYHFVEGLACDWKDLEIQEHTITKKFKSYPTPFSSKLGAASAFDLLFKRFQKSVLIISYSSNSQPTKDEMVAIIAKHKRHVDVIPLNYKYSFGNQGHKVGNNNNHAQEYIFVGY